MAKSKISEKELEHHREYMKKYQQHSADLEVSEMKYRDYYQLLDLPRTAAHKEIRQAYRKLALQYHPDRNQSVEAQERWDGVPAAYAVLSNPNSRMEYDATLPTRDALVEFYKSYNPAKLDNATIQTIVEGWHGREVELFQMLNVKYEIAPHQGTNKALQRAASGVPEERARRISRDCASAEGNGENARAPSDSYQSSFGQVFCCKGAIYRLFGATYYEVDTKSPGLNSHRSVSETPGQAADSAMKSPAPDRKRPEKTSDGIGEASYSNVDDENVSSATTTDDETEWRANAELEQEGRKSPPSALAG